MELNEINCLFCNDSNHPTVIQENNFDGKKCNKCNLIDVSPRPRLNDIIDLYGHDDANLSAESHIATSYQNKLYARHNLRIIKTYVDRGKLLEIGPGSGEFLNEARLNGFDSFGLELNKIQASYIRNNFKIPCEESTIMDSSYENNSFDIIYHCDVVSHFFNPIEEFKQMNKKLKSKGLVVFETGNLGDVNPKYYKYFERFQYPDHLFFFGEKSIVKMLNLTGFKIIKIHRYSILSQLRFLKITSKLILFILKFFIKKNDLGNNKQSKQIKSKHNKKSRISLKKIVKLFLRNSYFFVLYIIRYYVGFFNSKLDTPQTIVIVAKKE